MDTRVSFTIGSVHPIFLWLVYLRKKKLELDPSNMDILIDNDDVDKEVKHHPNLVTIVGFTDA